nr:e3 ubiquitin-protein ligase hel2 [Quercus suber]
MAQNLRPGAAKPEHHRSMSHGRGGAGNINSKQTTATTQSDFTTPTIKSQTYTTGRGGQGNMATNDPSNPAIARAAQDVDAPVAHQKEVKGTHHWGRGGEGNMVTVGGSEARTSSREGKGGRRTGSFVGDALEKGKEMLGMGKKPGANSKASRSFPSSTSSFTLHSLSSSSSSSAAPLLPDLLRHHTYARRVTRRVTRQDTSPMAPKTHCNALKLASVVSYLQKSRVAHNIKDLEKHLPSVASINGMQVKDYLQALQDDNKINVEKIGSGNWYWSFSSQDRRSREKALAAAAESHDKAAAAVHELKQKLAEVRSQREDEEGTLDDARNRREELVTVKAKLQTDIRALANELDTYKDNDPTELELKKREVQDFKTHAEQHTDEIESIDGYIMEQGADPHTMRQVREECRELVWVGGRRYFHAELSLLEGLESSAWAAARAVGLSILLRNAVLLVHKHDHRTRDGEADFSNSVTKLALLGIDVLAIVAKRSSALLLDVYIKPIHLATPTMADITSSPHDAQGTIGYRGGAGGVGGRGRGHHARGGGGGGGAIRARGGLEHGGEFRGRGRGRGRGGRGRGDHRDVKEHSNQVPGVAGDRNTTSTQPLSSRSDESSHTGRLVQNAQDISQGRNEGVTAGEDEVEAEVCFICASNISHQSVAPCNHRTCHICALRLRALYKTKACAHCRTEAINVIFTDEGEKRYEDYTASDFFETDKNLGVSYEKKEILEDTVLLLRYNCPEESCDVACRGWGDLKGHVRSVHQKVMCDLCILNKKVFSHEHELFTHQELKKHEKYGDDNPGAVDQSGFKGHPECGFCRQRFYGDDELYAHCRDNHERCHLCDRRTGSNSPQYFLNYNALEQHFSRDHFPCLDSECQEKKFVVFDSEMDLKAHQLEQHPNGLSKDARRDARRVNLSNFDYRPQYQESRPRGGGRRGGRGRDPNADPMPASSAGHMSRAEVAHQREREIQSAQTVSSRTFGGSLTQSEPQAQAPGRAAVSPRPTNAQPISSSANGQSASDAPANLRAAEALTPQEQARRLRHAAVTERASILLHNNQTKLTEFRDHVSAYRNGTISAPNLIDLFFTLFATSSAELGKLIKELADIFEVPGKSNALLKSWSDWKAINEDYPSLPGGPNGGSSASTAAGALGAGVGSSRVLKLKSSTAQSSRSVGAGAGSFKTWNTTLAPPGASHASSSSTPFPALPSAKKPASSTAGTGWLTMRPAAAGSSASSSAAPSRTHSSVNLRQTPASGDAFPALPAAKKPTSTVFSPGYKGAGILRPHVSSSVNAWQAAESASAPISPSTEPETEFKGKGKKGKKQILYNWG